MYKIGTYISYRSEGVCVINEIKQQKFGALDTASEYYVLSPIVDLNSKLYVPVNNEVLVSKMRPLCSADELNAMVIELREEKMEWIKEPRPRNNAFREILSLGDRVALIKLVHTLVAQAEVFESIGKTLTQGDEMTLKRAKDMLIAEFSFTTDVNNEQKLMDVLSCKVKCLPKS